jgi:two-component system LytT family response regulator
LIFLDIELNSRSGFELLPYLSVDTKVIFVTAYSEFAIKAIKERAFDYLLKPLNPMELKDCIERYQKETMGTTLAYKYIVVRESGESVPIKLEEIEYIRADGPYSIIHTVRKVEYTTAKTLKSLMHSLGQEFVRVHKSYLLNRHMIKSFKKDTITTIHNTCLPVSRVGSKGLSQFF